MYCGVKPLRCHVRDILDRSDQSYSPRRSGVDDQDHLSLQRCEVVGLAVGQLSLEIVESGHVWIGVEGWGGSEGTRL